MGGLVKVVCKGWSSSRLSTMEGGLWHSGLKVVCNVRMVFIGPPKCQLFGVFEPGQPIHIILGLITQRPSETTLTKTTPPLETP